jgi:hypothetical protein
VAVASPSDRLLIPNRELADIKQLVAVAWSFEYLGGAVVEGLRAELPAGFVWSPEATSAPWGATAERQGQTDPVAIQGVVIESPGVLYFNIAEGDIVNGDLVRTSLSADIDLPGGIVLAQSWEVGEA